ncbi:MAG: MerR family DNA-binding protein [Deltaproteobacteria bacterium]|nr:MerR family DNA-binding protein [Deltaproteobacteria bacterium]
METLTIGRVAKKAGVNIETIRYYERQGLIPRPPRRQSEWGALGYRHYPAETVKRIQFIRHAKELGFSLKEIAELLSLRIEQGVTCGDVRKRAEAKIADIDTRIKILQRMKKALVNLAKECKARGPVSECPILEALER